ncbi:MAG TPA: hypothetical protein VMR98_02010 [Candidatus Polarisedimenticolaceae bacterium]|nr:hypothetical protein [Candidatus Polarisedimenticolaceae bacterium]
MYLPYRNGDEIVIPVPFTEIGLVSLLGGRQFVITFMDDPSYGVFYGGTDGGSVFLVQLNDSMLWWTLRDRGEEAFFEALKPDIIKRLERELGSEGTRRQGDIYALPLPVGWLGIGEPKSGEHQVGETRHMISGRWMEIGDEGLTISVVSIGKDVHLMGLVGEGMLSAPDHSSVDLIHPHLIVRSGAVMGNKPEKVLAKADADSLERNYSCSLLKDCECSDAIMQLINENKKMVEGQGSESDQNSFTSAVDAESTEGGPVELTAAEWAILQGKDEEAAIRLGESKGLPPGEAEVIVDGRNMKVATEKGDYGTEVEEPDK